MELLQDFDQNKKNKSAEKWRKKQTALAGDVFLVRAI